MFSQENDDATCIAIETLSRLQETFQAQPADWQRDILEKLLQMGNEYRYFHRCDGIVLGSLQEIFKIQPVDWQESFLEKLLQLQVHEDYKKRDLTSYAFKEFLNALNTQWQVEYRNYSNFLRHFLVQAAVNPT